MTVNMRSLNSILSRNHVGKIFLAVLSALICLSCSRNGAEEPVLIPYPLSVEAGYGTFDVSGSTFYADTLLGSRTYAAVEDFRSKLSEASGKASAWVQNPSAAGFAVVCDPSLGNEEYKLDVTRRGVVVKASGLNGAVYALETVKQLLPVGIYAPQKAGNCSWELPAVKISDKPRFSYRGLHLDPARHFFDVAEVKRYIDIMVMHKMNTFHWHLTDDQGWRIEIRKYPKLTEVGAYRNKTLIGHLSSNQGFDHTRYGGFYTQDQIREVVEYAASKGVTVIPEIDLPGHMLAALAAYPEYGCTGGPYEVWGQWGVSEDVLCAGKEETFVFIEDVLTEVMELFPSEYIHIGGDESPKVRWEKCPACQARIRELGLKDTEEHTAEHYLQSYVTARVEKFLNEKGRKIIGWDEILEGELAPNATVMSWRGVGGGIQAARMGHDAIMTPNTYFYLDYCQSSDRDSEPLGIGGYLPVEKCYSYEPYAANMTDDEKKHIIGVQANLWTEYIKTADHLEYMLLPRAAALAEVQWCEPENKSWERFVASIRHYTDIYDILGYNYAKHIFDAKGKVSVNREKNTVELSFSVPERTVVRYTTDGTEPSQSSAVYTGPISVTESCTVMAKAEVDGAKTQKYAFEAHKAMGRPVTVTSLPSPSYGGKNVHDILVDGIRGGMVYGNGQWAGWQKKVLDAVVEMDGRTPYSSVTLGMLVVKGDWIYNPASLVVSISEDGKGFVEVAREEYEPEQQGTPDGLKEYTVSFPETSARYVRVEAAPLEAIPAWHVIAAGRPPFIFVDEMMIR